MLGYTCFTFGQQPDEATSYLETHVRQIASMASFEGLQDAILDFGIGFHNVAIHSDILHLRFLKAAAET
ncbi:MAG: hypothetical protein JNM65_00570 [Verrucomicrobiaceae bacterium]|nr:hypothetical protein [Verrucomicrobiaceae bacterium]